MKKYFVLALKGAFFTVWVLLAGCMPEQKRVDVSEVGVNIAAERFENDLATHIDNIAYLRSRYGSFLDLFAYQIVQMGTPDTVLLKSRLSGFVNDVDIRNIYADADKLYGRFDDINMHLTDAFRHYKYHFPDKLIPRVITFISGFNYGIISADSILGIGLDMYLGSDCPYYPALNLPLYKMRKMDRQHLAADAVRGWLQTEWEQNPEHTDLLSQMIYSGKLLYCLEQLMPGASDSIRAGYTQKQVEWCRASEKSIWSFFVDKKLLFVSDQSKILKYISEGATTNGFPKESPGNIAQWMGCRIVKAYMKQQPQVMLRQLMDEQDYQKIFRESKYKPER